MSEDRTLEIFAEKRMLPMGEEREQDIPPERRVWGVQEEERVLEVLPS